MRNIDWDRLASMVVCIAAAGALIWISARVLVLYLLPFVLAWVLSVCLSRPSERLARRLHCSQKLSSILLFTAVLSVIVLLIGATISRLLRELQGFLARLLEREHLSDVFFSEGNDYFESVASKIKFFERFSISQNGTAFRERFNQMVGDALTEAIASVSAELPRVAARIISGMPTVLLFIGVTVISGFYFCIDRRGIEEGLLSLLPQGMRGRIPLWGERIKCASFRYLRAYLWLLMLTFLELFIGFCILRVEYAFLLAALIAVVDLLPVLGVGTILVPWAVIELINRDVRLGIGLLILYGIVSVAHQVLEPKLVGKSLGLHPLLTLMAGYIGYRTFGFLGMAVAPFVALFCKSLLRARAEDGGATEQRRKV